MNDPRLLLLDPADDVFVAIRAIEAGERLTIGSTAVAVAERIPLGFKVAARRIAAGDKIRKYGASIGSATREIAAGDVVHVHNMKSDYLPTYTIQEQHRYVQARP